MFSCIVVPAALRFHSVVIVILLISDSFSSLHSFVSLTGDKCPHSSFSRGGQGDFGAKDGDLTCGTNSQVSDRRGEWHGASVVRGMRL